MPVLHKAKIAIPLQSETTLGQKTVNTVKLNIIWISYVPKRERFLNKKIPNIKCRTPYNLRQASFR